MPITQYDINSRPLTAFSTLQQELSFDPTKNYLFDLSCLGSIDLTGDRGSEFLQGQLTCDLREVSPQQMRQGATCDLKGRILSLLDVVQWHGLHLILPNDLLEKTQTSLAKTALFSQVKLNPTSSFQLFGFLLQNDHDVMPCTQPLPTEAYQVVSDDTYCCYSLGGGCYVFLVESSHASSMRDAFVTHNQWRGSLAWHALQLKHHRFDIYPESRGLFLPHRLDLHKSSCLSFNKGCYKGQEIIARMHYRAKRKHEMMLFTIKTNEPLQSGKKLWSEDGSIEIGELIDYCPLGDDVFLIAASIIFDHPETCLIDGHQGKVALQHVV